MYNCRCRSTCDAKCRENDLNTHMHAYIHHINTGKSTSNVTKNLKNRKYAFENNNTRGSTSYQQGVIATAIAVEITDLD